MTTKKDQKDYQKPELVHINDPAFDEKGQGASVIPKPPGFKKDKDKKDKDKDKNKDKDKRH